MKKNPRVGCRGFDASHMIPVSFQVVSDAFVAAVQRQYATGFYTQSELADRYKTSPSLIGKICRCSDENVDLAVRNIRKKLKTKTRKLRKVS